MSFTLHFFQSGDRINPFLQIGWFILLTSLLGFWRVKRWERSILASQRDGSSPPSETPSPLSALAQMESTFGFRGAAGARIDLFRQGFGFGNRNRREEDNTTRRAEEGTASTPMEAIRARLVAETAERDRILQVELREAGFL